MCRSYSPRSVPRCQVLRIVEAARRVPTAGHAQGVRLAVVSEPAIRKSIASAFGEEDYLKKGFSPWLSVAPVHIVVATREQSYRERYAEPDKKGNPEDWPVPYAVLDAGQSLMALYLAAENCGLACGYLGPHAGQDLVQLLDLPEDWRFLGLVTLGYRFGPQPQTKSQRRGWINFDEAVRWLS